MDKEQQKVELVAKELDNFIKQFGEDIYAQILLEVLIEGLENEETLFIFGGTEQKGNEIIDSITNGQGNNIENRKFESIEAPSNMGEEDSTNSS